ncbi:MAG TPA: hypothetical protein VGL76_05830 [Gaiellaceae bacterium]
MRFVAVVLVALAVTPVASAALPNACTLISNTQVAPLIGGKVGTRIERGTSLYHTCTWTSVARGHYGVHSVLTVSVGAETKAQFVHGAEQIPGAHPVAGLGQVAFMQKGGRGSISAWDKGYAVQIFGSLVQVYPSRAKGVAKLAVAHL